MFKKLILVAVLLFCFSVESKAAITYVQTASGTGSGTTVSTGPINTTTGHNIAITLAWQFSSNTLVSVVNSAAQTVNCPVYPVGPAISSEYQAHCNLANITGNIADVFTATFSGGTVVATIVAIETTPAAVVDYANADVCFAGSCSIPVTTSAADSLVMFDSYNPGGGSNSPGVNRGTIIYSSGTLTVAYEILTSIVTASNYTITDNSGSGHVILVSTYNEIPAEGGGGSNSDNLLMLGVSQ